MTMRQILENVDVEESVSFRNTSLHYHLNFIKWIGIIVIALICTIPVFLIYVYSDCGVPANDGDIRPNLNQTVCTFVEQFHLQDNLYATVCNQANYVFLDIREFINGTATIRGIDLNLLQWISLKRFTSSIDKVMTLRKE
jgi:hypothetical protein